MLLQVIQRWFSPHLLKNWHNIKINLSTFKLAKINTSLPTPIQYIDIAQPPGVSPIQQYPLNIYKAPYSRRSEGQRQTHFTRSHTGKKKQQWQQIFRQRPYGHFPPILIIFSYVHRCIKGCYTIGRSSDFDLMCVNRSHDPCSSGHWPFCLFWFFVAEMLKWWVAVQTLLKRVDVDIRIWSFYILCSESFYNFIFKMYSESTYILNPKVLCNLYTVRSIWCTIAIYKLPWQHHIIF